MQDTPTTASASGTQEVAFTQTRESARGGMCPWMTTKDGNASTVLTQGKGGVGGGWTLRAANGLDNYKGKGHEDGYLSAGGDVIQMTSWNSDVI